MIQTYIDAPPATPKTVKREYPNPTQPMGDSTQATKGAAVLLYYLNPARLYCLSQACLSKLNRACSYGLSQMRIYRLARIPLRTSFTTLRAKAVVSMEPIICFQSLLKADDFEVVRSRFMIMIGIILKRSRLLASRWHVHFCAIYRTCSPGLNTQINQAAMISRIRDEASHVSW